MVTINGSTLAGIPWEFYGESGDTKPTTINDAGDPVPVNSFFFEEDTATLYYFADTGEWKVVGGE